MTASHRIQVLSQVLRGFAVLLILRVLLTILANYPDYFPPRFESQFLQGRELTFTGLFATAFYVHIVCSPFILLNGLLLLSETLRRRYPRYHRFLGRIQVVVLLLLVLPSSVVMSGKAFAGWQAGLSFLCLSVSTAICTVVGVIQARSRNYAAHRRWMWRCYVLICSAIVLRLISGAAEVLEVSSAERAYVFAAWSSWLIPLAILEILLRWDPVRFARFSARLTRINTLNA